MEVNIYDYSYKFALNIVNVCSNLKKKNEFTLSKQLLRAGTSIEQICEKQNMLKVRRPFWINECDIKRGI